MPVPGRRLAAHHQLQRAGQGLRPAAQHRHLLRSRLPDGAFLYGEYLEYSPRHGINQLKGSACRNPLCHYALELFDVAPPEVTTVVSSLEDLLIRHAAFQRAAVRRPIPHESWYAVSGYFYLYGHAYASYVLQLQTAEVQKRLWPEMLEAVLWCRQPDGSYWDYPLYSYHKPYGTGFALQVLNRVPRDTKLPPRDENGK